MSFEEITKKIEEKLRMAPSIGAIIALDFGDGGTLTIDATQSPPALSQDELDADTTLICSIDTFKQIAAGTQDPTLAYMTGKLKIKGNMGVAMKLNTLLED